MSKTFVLNRAITTNQIFNYGNIAKNNYINLYNNIFYIGINLYININLYIDFGIYIKTNTGSVTISQFLFYFLLSDNTYIQLNKLYKNEKQFNKTKNNFLFKPSVFYNKYQLIGLLLNAYYKNTSVILTNEVQTYFYANCNFIISFKNFC